MKLLKTALLFVLLGLSLMGGDCGGGSITKCPDFEKVETCEAVKKVDNSNQCKWEVTKVVATCERSKTPACLLASTEDACTKILGCKYSLDKCHVADCPTMTSHGDISSVKDMENCVKSGCQYQPFSVIARCQDA